MKQDELLKKIPRSKWAARHQIVKDGTASAFYQQVGGLIAKGQVLRRQVQRDTRDGAARRMWEYRRA